MFPRAKTASCTREISPLPAMSRSPGTAGSPMTERVSAASWRTVCPTGTTVPSSRFTARTESPETRAGTADSPSRASSFLARSARWGAAWARAATRARKRLPANSPRAAGSRACHCSRAASQPGWSSLKASQAASKKARSSAEYSRSGEGLTLGAPGGGGPGAAPLPGRGGRGPPPAHPPPPPPPAAAPPVGVGGPGGAGGEEECEAEGDAAVGGVHAHPFILPAGRDGALLLPGVPAPCPARGVV